MQRRTCQHLGVEHQPESRETLLCIKVDKKRDVSLGLGESFFDPTVSEQLSFSMCS